MCWGCPLTAWLQFGVWCFSVCLCLVENGSVATHANRLNVSMFFIVNPIECTGVDSHTKGDTPRYIETS